MGTFIKLYITAAAVFLLFDLVWLLVISKNLYQEHIGHLMGTTKMAPAIVFYLLYVLGIVVFILNPGVTNQTLLHVVLMGGFLGLLCYSTYDLTNLATLKGWPVQLTVIDLVWGTFVTAAASGITYAVAQHFQWR